MLVYPTVSPQSFTMRDSFHSLLIPAFSSGVSLNVRLWTNILIFTIGGIPIFNQHTIWFWAQQFSFVRVTILISSTLAGTSNGRNKHIWNTSNLCQERTFSTNKLIICECSPSNLCFLIGTFAYIYCPNLFFWYDDNVYLCSTIKPFSDHYIVVCFKYCET